MDDPGHTRNELPAHTLLTTTRSVRRRLDWHREVDPAAVERALSVALQAPNGSNDQLWHWIVVTDPQRRAALADCYRRAARPYLHHMEQQVQDDPARRRLWEVSCHLARHLHRAPVLVVPCLRADPEDFVQRFTAMGFDEPVEHVAHSVYYGSVWPSMWSLMLALHLEDLACAVTALHLGRESEAAGILALPEGVRQAGLLAVAHYRGEGFRPAPRRPLHDVLHHDTW
ncbi:MAG TPA: nitroreductase family protein [Streptomyces sp.]|uniref:nitroreductase family protein n=1 Tax=Streptomyces sp. TaxID=1931 RepID=UPI002B63D523|nr:nitroreductase family protein [Streptomyces sp.]HWU05976.1 nitroreductase family protein [Streptomyces sp.]